MPDTYEYTLTMTTAQAREVQNALEAIMRWMLKQSDIMREYLPDRLDWKQQPISLPKAENLLFLKCAMNWQLGWNPFIRQYCRRF